MKDRITTNKGVMLGALIFLSLVLRLMTALPVVFYPDSCLYLSFARSILRGKFSFNFNEGIETVLPPLYPGLSALVSIFAGNMELSAIIVSAVAGAFLVVPVFYLAKAVYNEKAAWISSVFIFLSPLLIYWSGAALTEALFTTLFVSGITVCIYAIRSERQTLFFVSGALIGLSYMARVIGLVAIPVVLFWIIYSSVSSVRLAGSYPAQIVRKAAASSALFFLGFILITGVYLIHLHSFYGNWTLAGSYGSIEGTIAFEGAESRAGWENAATPDSGEGSVSRLINKVVLNAENYSVSLISKMPLDSVYKFIMIVVSVLFVVPGLFFGRKEGGKGMGMGVLFLVSFIVVYYAALLLLPLSPMIDERIRYLSPISPLFMVIASGGIIRIQERMKSGMIRQAAIPVMVLVAMLSSLPLLEMFPLRMNQLWRTNASLESIQKIGLWMKGNLPQPVRVMSRKPYIPYYAEALWFTTPATHKEVMELARSKEIDYIVVDKRVEYYLRPELRFLFYPKDAPKDFAFIGGIQNKKTGELSIGLYKINRTVEAPIW
ncbi:MAG: glycosyltransferase family 39 protein [Nitrospirae bacterium]|nr:glycosyltransferase family 39 protein [Nitrospirota bacterium]